MVAPYVLLLFAGSASIYKQFGYSDQRTIRAPLVPYHRRECALLALVHRISNIMTSRDGYFLWPPVHFDSPLRPRNTKAYESRQHTKTKTPTSTRNPAQNNTMPQSQHVRTIQLNSIVFIPRDSRVWSTSIPGSLPEDRPFNVIDLLTYTVLQMQGILYVHEMLHGRSISAIVRRRGHG